MCVCVCVKGGCCYCRLSLFLSNQCSSLRVKKMRINVRNHFSPSRISYHHTTALVEVENFSQSQTLHRIFGIYTVALLWQLLTITYSHLRTSFHTPSLTQKHVQRSLSKVYQCLSKSLQTLCKRSWLKLAYNLPIISLYWLGIWNALSNCRSGWILFKYVDWVRVFLCIVGAP